MRGAEHQLTQNLSEAHDQGTTSGSTSSSGKAREDVPITETQASGLPSSAASTSVEQTANTPSKPAESEIENRTPVKKLNFSSGGMNTDVELEPYGVDSDRSSDHTNFTESTNVPRRNLGYIQTTSLMINATIGYSVFTNPGYVLALVKSKEICMVLWAVGGIYSAIAITIFLEYGTALPFNGMALIYLDEVFPRPKLLATVVFSVYWIVFAGTVTLSNGIAQNILALANPQAPSTSQPGLHKFTAIVIQTVSCLLLYFARRLVFVFNTAFAVYKIILLLVIFIAGVVASRGANFGLDDFDTEYPNYSGVNTLTAMIYIIISYEGWQNAIFVAGEIKDYKRTLKWAAVTTIVVVTCLNMLATFGMYAVTDYATITNKAGQSNAAIQFAQKIFGTSTGMTVAVALSAFSAHLIQTYTYSKGMHIKQAIAWQRIIPFYRFFGYQDPHLESPGGALFLHWLVTVIELLAVNLNTDQRPFFTGIFSYGYQLMFALLGVGLPRLQARMRLLNPTWKPTYLKNRAVMLVICFIFVSINIITLVIEALPATPGTTPRFYWPITIAGVFVVGVLYWGFLRLLQARGLKTQRTLGARLGLEVKVYEEGDDDIPADMRGLLRDAARDGSRRRLQYKISGPASKVRSSYYKAHDVVFGNLGY
ncbi:MAG: hypothetical protein M1820_003587 [Bogoriella megaspora]|nr:MAG: hypothetical protein M1820_003587 [Bogoriella megaspora]